MLSLTEAAKPIYNRIRPFTPRKYISYSGIAIQHGRLFDLSDEREFKPEAVEVVKNSIRSGDHVVEVATGHGVFSLICAVRGATVDSYECSAERIQDATSLHELVGVENVIEVHRGFVGESNGRPPDDFEGDRIAPSDLPKCDVLLLDCEGAELEIIRGVAPRPPKIIVETHPSQGAPTADVERVLIDRNYRITSKQRVNARKHILVASES